jgi:hypothetical protein
MVYSLFEKVKIVIFFFEHVNSYIENADPEGFEPPTPWLRAKYSSQAEPWAHNVKTSCICLKKFLERKLYKA